MVVDTMSYDEVEAELLKAWEEVAERIVRKMEYNKSKYRRQVIKSKKTRLGTIKFNTTRGITFSVIPICKNRKSIDKMRCTVYTTFSYKEHTLIALIGTGNMFLIFTKHAFFRFFERARGICNVEFNEENVDDFMYSNNVLYGEDYRTPKGRDCIMCATECGAFLCVKISSEIVVANTFIDDSLVRKGKQKELVDFCQMTRLMMRNMPLSA